VILENSDEVAFDVDCRTAFDAQARQEVDDRAVLEQRDARARRRDVREVAARAARRVLVLAREHGREALRPHLALHRAHDAGTRHARGATADGVDDEEAGLLLGDPRVDRVGSPQFHGAVVGEFCAHRRNEVFWIHGACSGRWRRAG